MPPVKPVIPVTEMPFYLGVGSIFCIGVSGDRIGSVLSRDQYEQYLTFTPGFRC